MSQAGSEPEGPLLGTGEAAEAAPSHPGSKGPTAGSHMGEVIIWDGARAIVTYDGIVLY